MYIIARSLFPSEEGFNSWSVFFFNISIPHRFCSEVPASATTSKGKMRKKEKCRGKKKYVLGCCTYMKTGKNDICRKYTRGRKQNIGKSPIKRALPPTPSPPNSKSGFLPVPLDENVLCVSN